MMIGATVHVGGHPSLIVLLIFLLISLNVGLFIWGVRNKGRLPEWPFFVQGSMALLSALVLAVMDKETELGGYCAIICLLMYLMGVILIWVNRK